MNILQALNQVQEWAEKCPSDAEMEPLLAENKELDKVWFAFSVWVRTATPYRIEDTEIGALAYLLKVAYWLGSQQKANGLDVFEEHYGGGDVHEKGTRNS